MKLNKLTFDEVREIAKQYNHKIDFKKGNNRAYQTARRKGWYDEITTHMTPKGNRYTKLVYRYDFPNNVVYFGVTNDKSKRIHSHKKKGSVYDYALITNQKPTYTEITDYIDKVDALNMEKELIKEYKDLGWKVLNRTNGGENGGGEEFITKEMCQQEALKYKYRFEFTKNSRRYYDKAQKRKWLDDVCSHMENKCVIWDEDKIYEAAQNSGLSSITEFAKKYKGAYECAKRIGISKKLIEFFGWKGGKSWTYESLKDEASKYDNVGDFKKYSRPAYVSSQKYGFFNELTKNMKRRGK